jgi:hypothetical protein
MARFIALGVALLAAGFAWMLPASGLVQAATPVEYTRFDVTLDLRTDGSIHVTEKLVIAFYAGPFEQWEREISTARMDSVTNVEVREQTFGDRPYSLHQSAGELWPGTFNWQATDDSMLVRWRFEPVTSAQRIFLVEYDVMGALRVYPDSPTPTQQIWWTAIDASHSASAPIKDSTLVVRLPLAVDLGAVHIGQGGDDDPLEHSTDGQRFVWEFNRVRSGDDTEVRLKFPPIVAGVVAPAWQAADDAADEHEQALLTQRRNRRALLDVLFLASGLLLISGSGVALYGAWHARGRDPNLGLIADYLPEPPDDLPPGAVGTLLDERADHCDVVATLADLGRRRVLTITEVSVPNGSGGQLRRDFELTLTKPCPPVAPFEEALLRALFGPDLTRPWQPKLSEVSGRFAKAQGRITEALYSELCSRGYFARSPEETRSRWRKAGVIGLAVSVTAGAVLGIGFGGLAWFPAVVAPGLPLAVLKMSRSMPKKTSEGAEAAARWHAFRRYLESNQRYRGLALAEGKFEQYLPFAIAFGMDGGVLPGFTAAPSPGWLVKQTAEGLSDPATLRALDDFGAWGGKLLLDGLSNVDLQQASDLFAGGLQASSDGLAALLSAAADAFSSIDLDL